VPVITTDPKNSFILLT